MHAPTRLAPSLAKGQIQPFFMQIYSQGIPGICIGRICGRNRSVGRFASRSIYRSRSNYAGTSIAALSILERRTNVIIRALDAAGGTYVTVQGNCPLPARAVRLTQRGLAVNQSLIDRRACDMSFLLYVARAASNRLSRSRRTYTVAFRHPSHKVAFMSQSGNLISVLSVSLIFRLSLR